MNREETIEMLKALDMMLRNSDGEPISDVCDALGMAIEALSEPSGDLISRADAMGAVQDHFNADGFKGYDDGQKMMDRIKALPSADASQNLTKPIKALKGSDLISRDVVLANIDERLRANGYGNVGLVSELNRLIGYVRNIPSAEAEWIPCSERLPSEDGQYFVCMYDGQMDVYMWAEGWNCIRRVNGMVTREYEIDGTVAWMPLPKPYKAESEDEE